MAQVVTSKKINLSQLDAELGSQGLSSNENDSTAIIIATSDESTVTQAQLEAGVAAHIAQPTAVQIALLTRQAGISHALSIGFTQAQAEAMFP